NVATDLALNGSGYFVTQGLDGQILTRAGNFVFNQDGLLVTGTSGLKVQAFRIDANGEVDMSQLSDVQIDFAAQAPPKFTENMDIGGNLPADAPIGEEVTLSNKIYDEQGNVLNVVTRFTKTAENEWSFSIENDEGGFTAASGTMTFNVDGSLDTPDSVGLTWDTDFVTSGSTLTVDFSGMTQYGGSSTATVRDQDGYASGKLSSFTIDPAGKVKLNFTNGQQEEVYQLAISDVDNPNGLEQLGENFYAPTAASGETVTGRAGNELQTTIVAGTLEMSNVDLAEEFTSMIIAQRGYQASARVITTSDEILQETVQLKR
ncbi:MAG: flagellar hook-basal body complex protein, partial [Bacteroidetes bacterium]